MLETVCFIMQLLLLMGVAAFAGYVFGYFNAQKIMKHYDISFNEVVILAIGRLSAEIA